MNSNRFFWQNAFCIGMYAVAAEPIFFTRTRTVESTRSYRELEIKQDDTVHLTLDRVRGSRATDAYCHRSCWPTCCVAAANTVCQRYQPPFMAVERFGVRRVEKPP